MAINGIRTRHQERPVASFFQAEGRKNCGQISTIFQFEQALTAINALDELLETGFSGRELTVVEKMIHELDRLENEADKLEVTIRASLFNLEAQLPPVDVIFLYSVIDWIGDLANRAHDVGGRLQLLLAR